jgi:PAS domain S-box-containing protein
MGPVNSAEVPGSEPNAQREPDGAVMSDQLRTFEAFIRHLPGACWVKDGSGKYLYVNASTAQVLGLPRADVLGKTDFDLLPKPVAEVLYAHDQEVLRTGKSLEVLEQIPHGGGGTRSWFSAKFLLPLADARCTAGFAIEITHLTEAKRHADGVLQQILDAITDMVLVKGPRSRLEWANKAFLSTYGMTNEQLKGLIDAPFIEPDVTQQYVRDDAQVFATGRTLEILEEPMIRHDGRVLTCHTVKSPIFDDHGAVIKTVAVIRDTTERKRLELELRQAQKLESVGRLASGIAHEINTPIQFVRDQAGFMRSSMRDLMALCQQYRAFLQKSEQGRALPEDISALRRTENACGVEFILENVPLALDSICEGTTQVAHLVRALQEFGHPARGVKGNADVNRALETTVLIAGNELKFGADVEMDLGILPDVLCYASDLNQVFLNLIVNAAHAIGEVVARTGERGKIHIQTRHVGSDVIIRISDTGTGIPEALHTKIFDAFFTTKEVGKGTGQGLAIARMIVVEKHQGTLTFETELGLGTTFQVKIPVNGG